MLETKNDKVKWGHGQRGLSGESWKEIWLYWFLSSMVWEKKEAWDVSEK